LFLARVPEKEKRKDDEERLERAGERGRRERHSSAFPLLQVERGRRRESR